MRVLIQRVSKASVRVDAKVVGSINHGYMILLGIGQNDSQEDISWLVRKIINLRIFSDEEGKMNRSIQDVHGSILLISQFTLYASTKKGNRPSYINAAVPDMANRMYEEFGQQLSLTGIPVETGIFAADMKVSLINDGPVTIMMDSKNKE